MRKPEENNELGKYEQEFARLMQETVAKHREDDMDLNIDYSFLDDYERVVIDTAKKRHFKKSFVRVAVILLVFFSGISVAMVTDVTTDASAWKANVARRLYVLKEGFVSTDPDVSVNYKDEYMMTVVIDDFDKIEKARKVAPGLAVPSYIPHEYAFDNLTIEVSYDGIYNAMYQYSNNNNDVFSIYIYYDPANYTTDVEGVVEKIELDEKTIYIWKDVIEEMYGATIFDNEYTVNIVGSLDSNEVLKIAKELN